MREKRRMVAPATASARTTKASIEPLRTGYALIVDGHIKASFEAKAIPVEPAGLACRECAGLGSAFAFTRSDGANGAEDTICHPDTVVRPSISGCPGPSLVVTHCGSPFAYPTT